MSRRVLAVALTLLTLAGPITSTGIVAAGALTGTVQSSGGVPYSAASGPTITLNGTTQINTTTSVLFPSSDTVQFITTDGNATFSSSGSAEAAIAAGDITGPKTKLTSLSVASNSLTVNPEDKPKFTVGGGMDMIDVKAGIVVDGGGVDFAYTSSTSQGTLTLNGLPAGTQLSAVDANGNVLDAATVQADNSVTFTALDTGTYDIRLQTSSSAAPVLTSLSPTGDLQQAPSTASVAVDDPDFGSGETLNVTLSVDGSQQTQTTLNSAGTVSASVPTSATTPGRHTVSATAVDQFGETTTTSTEFFVPGNLSVFNESAPASKLTNANVEIRGFKNGEIFTRTTSNGDIDLSGIPTQRDFAVRISAPGYQTTTVHLESVFQQARVYALPENATTNDIVFQLDDQTGAFQNQDTFIQVLKPINRTRNGTTSTEFEVLRGDTFGSAGEFATKLENSTRYRIAVENRQGDRRELGSYTVTGDDAVELSVGTIVFSSERDSGVAFQSTLQEFNGSRFVKVQYRDGDRQTSSLTYEIVRNDGSTVLDNETVSGPFGSYQATVAVPGSAPDDVSYEVRYTADRGQNTSTGSTFVGDIPEIAQNLSMDPTVLAYISWVLIAAITGLVVIFDDGLAALTGTATATALTLLGAVSIPPLALSLAGVISIVANVGRIR